ncbi:MAG TPA: hypothetical protein VF546_13365 [Pyrinomonadaceae bacterium]|jgi:hypothetical protein
MTRRLTILAVSLVLLGITVFAFRGQINPTVLGSGQSRPVPEVPDQVVYRHLFRHAAALKAKADELERQGKDATHLHNFFKHKAELSDDQAQILEDIADQCARDIKALDEKAKPIIAAYKAQYPNGQVPHGEKPQPPPAELYQLTLERNDVVLRSRDKLRAALGEGEFNRFHAFVRSKIAPNVNPVSAEQ